MRGSEERRFCPGDCGSRNRGEGNPVCRGIAAVIGDRLRVWTVGWEHRPRVWEERRFGRKGLCTRQQKETITIFGGRYL